MLEATQQTIDVQNYPFGGHAGKKTYLLVQTEDMSSCPVQNRHVRSLTKNHVFLLNKKTCHLEEQDVMSEEDRSSC